MKVVAIGGGHGAAATLRAALTYSDGIAGVISVADDGGSSGRLAQELGVLPMGDIRNCLAALAPPSPTVDIFQHRFSTGSLEGHVVGNLVLAAVTQETGSFMTAIEYAGQMLGTRGRIVPPTLDPVRLVSEVEGERVEGQVALATAAGRVNFVGLDPPNPKAFPEALELVADADHIVLGPGSLFTSVIPPLLVPDLRGAFLSSTARKIYICNITSPPGETEGFDAGAHLDAVFAHLGPESVDVLVAHAGRRPSGEALEVAAQAGAVEEMGVEAVTADLLPDDQTPRHDPERLGAVLRKL